MVDDIKIVVKGDVEISDIPDDVIFDWLTALVEYYEAAESQGFDVWHRDLTNYQRLQAARKRLEGKP